jgi:hypothetical protein
MRARTAVVLFFLTAFPASTASAAAPRSDLFLSAMAPPSAGNPRGAFAGSNSQRAQADTVWFGGFDGSYAVEGGVWDFDDGTMQGWYGVDLTENSGPTWWQRVTAADFECLESAPMLAGTVGQLWLGGQQSQADAECWICDEGQTCSLGYVNDLTQRIESSEIPYAGGDVALQFDYFSDCEGRPFDYTRGFIVAFAGGEELDSFDFDELGGVIGDPENPATFAEMIEAEDLPEETTDLKIRFDFQADGGWSDEDGLYCSTYGAFAIDNVVLNIDGGNPEFVEDFDEGQGGWIASHIPGVGNFVELNHVSDYEILDACDCGLEGHLMTFHDESGGHPQFAEVQINMAVSPIIDRSEIPAAYSTVFYELEMYADLPVYNCVRYRPGVMFYPDPACNGGWSPRMGSPVWIYTLQNPICFLDSRTLSNPGVPGDAQRYRFVFEVISCGSCWSEIPLCTGITNETPLIDNIRFGLATSPDAPVIELSSGLGVDFQDGFSQGPILDPTDPGRSDVWLLPSPAEPPYTLGDSLVVTGPVVNNDGPSWESYLWLRVDRVGPGVAGTAWNSWKSRFASDPETGFVFVKMDSVETVAAFKNKFCSYFHEDDPGFQTGSHDLTDGNEIFPDDLFTPGTRIEYFFTGNYVGNEGRYLLPDTAGATFLEFEILPSMRDDGEGGVVWPCILYVDAYNESYRDLIQEGLEAILPEIPGPGPNHDRYDEQGMSSGTSGSALYRLTGGNNGATLPQLLGYRTVVVNTGRFGAGAMDETDMLGLDDWLHATVCDAGSQRQGLILSGNEAASIVETLRPFFLSGSLGTRLECVPYREAGCPPGTDPDTSGCVALLDAGAAEGYPPGGASWIFGNSCPIEDDFSVLSPAGTGIGNRDYWDYDGTKGEVGFAQVVNENLGSGNFRTVLTGYGLTSATTTFDGSTCQPDPAGRVAAIAAELQAALGWIFDGAPPSFCSDPCTDVTETPEGGVLNVAADRLFQNEPNPFNPRTVLRFSTAAKGKVAVEIFDVSGRKVKTLVSEAVEPGLHTAVWDGTDDAGRRVGSGLYWSQLTAGDYVSTKKMILLK